MYISNWRPISLQNVDVKIATKALAKRLETILPKIIHRNQCAYVKRRSICDCTRIIDDIMFYTKEYGLSGLAVAIDFEKAFDSLDWEYLNKALSAFNFGESFIKWVNIFYRNIQSCVMNNGFSSTLFDVHRGVRQGDPLSPYLFIVALETLAINIRSSSGIEGIKLKNGREIKLTLFADDMKSFLKNKRSFENLTNLLQDFGSCSGLKVNESKLEALNLGEDGASLNIGLGNTTKPLKTLGIFFSYDKTEAYKLNFESILDQLKKKTLNLWKWRNLTILGKIQILKTFAISKFLYPASQLSFPKDLIKRANKIIYDFLWNGVDKVKRNALINDIEDGGLKMIHLEPLIQAQKISFFKRYADPNYVADWKFILDTYLKPFGGPYILRRGTSGFAVLRCCSVFCAVFRWIKSHTAVLRWSQTLRCAMFVLFSLRCSVKRNYLRCCDTSSINTVYTQTMRYGRYIWLNLWCVCRIVPTGRQPAELTGYLVRLCRLLLWFFF